MSMPTPAELEEHITEGMSEIERLKKAHAHFLSQWKILEEEQAALISVVRTYSEKIKMREVLEHIHSIKE